MQTATRLAQGLGPRALLLSLIVLVAAVNFGLLAISLLDGFHSPFDWAAYSEAGRRFWEGTLYDWSGDYSFRYAPVAALLLGGLTTVGITAWRVVQVLATLALPSRVLTLLVLLSYAFYFDVDTGNTMIFVLLAASWALRGNQIATGAYLVMTLLIPRPLMLPVAAWIIWKRPEWRLPAVLLVVLVVGSTLATGYAAQWGHALVAATDDLASSFNFGPSAILGGAWLIIGIPLAAWLTYKGRLGWASLAVSPYLLPYYFLMLGLEWPGVRPRTDAVAQPAARSEPAVP